MADRWGEVFTVYQQLTRRVLGESLRDDDLAQRALALAFGIGIAMVLAAGASAAARGPNPQALVLAVGAGVSFTSIATLWLTRKPWLSVATTILGCYLPVTFVIWTGFGPIGPAATAQPLLIVFGSVTGGRKGAVFTLGLSILQSGALWFALRAGWTFQQPQEGFEALFLFTTMIISLLVLIVLDVYEQAHQRAQRALQDALDDLQVAHDRAEQARDVAVRASKAKSVFLANMSHELRTPLNAIIGYAELLDEDLELPEAAAKADVHRIHQAGHHLLRLVNDVLDMSRIEADRLELTPQDVDVGELLNEVVDRLTGSANRRGNTLHVALPPGSFLVHQDPLRLDQVLTNLLSNAVKFTEHGRIDVEVQHRGQQVHIAVADTGRGMAPELVQRCFLPFEQAPGGTAGRGQGGTGLGLAISSQLVQAMGGVLTASSTPGIGSRFTITMPVVQPLPSLSDA